MSRRSLPLLGLSLLVAAPALSAQDLELPFEFRAGDPARADEVNQNFAALVDVVKELRAELDTLRPQVTELAAENDELRSDLEVLQSQIGPLDLDVADLQALTVQFEQQIADVEDKTQFVSISDDAIEGLRGPHMILEKVNLHVRSGTGTTDDGASPTGLGNIVIGYNESESTPERTGSHNLVVGSGHEYTSTGGIVAGIDNSISGLGASVLGGTNNSASGELAVVSGGAFNQAIGEESAVSGGVSNFATALRASASGGAQNTVSGIAASIVGGSGGAAGGFASCISGGQSGIASGDQSSVTGGQSNSAFGNKAAVSGGFNINVNNDFDWAACDLSCQ